MTRLVRFVRHDPYALWEAGEYADDLGPESPGSSLRLLRRLKTGELIALSHPYERNLIERVQCGHDGWTLDCPVCEAEEEFTKLLTGES